MRMQLLPARRLILVALILVCTAAAHAAEPAIAYTVTMPQPSKHVFHVTMEIREPAAASFEVRMPVWMQAVYELQNYAEQVAQLKAHTPAGEPVELRPVSDHAWQISLPRPAPVIIEYDLDVGNRHKLFGKSYLEKSGAVIHGGAFFLYSPELRRAPASLSIELPKDWAVASSLVGSSAPGRAEFTTQDYDELTDSPVMLGEFERTDFTVGGIIFSVVTDERLKSRHKNLVASAQKIAAHTLDFFGGAPFDRYLFLYFSTSDPSGAGHNTPMVGYEHLKSTLITADPDLNGAPQDFTTWLYRTVSAHELFHAWNVKAIRPAQLHYPDFDAPPSVRSLWLLEGFTEFYAQKFILQLFEGGRPDNFYTRMNRNLRACTSAVSLEQISLKAATEPLDEFSLLYSRGSAAGLLLDLKLREVTRNERGLDDFMRALWLRYGATRTPYDESALPGLLNEIAATDLSRFHRQHLAGAWPLPLAEYLRLGGWGIKGPTTRSTLIGLNVNPQTSEITDLLAGGNAELSGLKVGDRIIALNGKAFGAVTEWHRLLEKGRELVITIERQGERQEVSLKPEAKVPLEPVMYELPDATPQQLATRRAVLSATTAAARASAGSR
ncbi:MAG TPA: PDZ domain-containing protein [Blastocatellia bacterium]|nr:PDZ domain-containing protein [Blastocatellia bacterium]